MGQSCQAWIGDRPPCRAKHAASERDAAWREQRDTILAIGCCRIDTLPELQIKTVRGF
jgi:hypothetical protein